jgi:hypothetical protein
MQTQRVSGHTALITFNTGRKWRWMVSLMSAWPLYPQGKSPLKSTEQVAGWAPDKHLVHAGILTPDHPACSLVTILTTLSWSLGWQHTQHKVHALSLYYTWQFQFIPAIVKEKHYFNDKHHLNETEISSILIACLSLFLFCGVVRKVEHWKKAMYV